MINGICLGKRRWRSRIPLNARLDFFAAYNSKWRMDSHLICTAYSCYQYHAHSTLGDWVEGGELRDFFFYFF